MRKWGHFILIGLLLILALVSCAPEGEALQLVEVRFSTEDTSSKAVSANMHQHLVKFLNAQNVVLYVKCTPIQQSVPYCSIGTDEDKYVRYNGAITLSQGMWSFDAVLIDKGKDPGKLSIEESDLSSFTIEREYILASNPSYCINLNSSAIPLYIAMGTNSGTLNFTYSTGDDYKSSYQKENVNFDGDSDVSSRNRWKSLTKQRESSNTLQHIEVEIIKLGTDEPIIQRNFYHFGSDDLTGESLITHESYTRTIGNSLNLVASFEDGTLEPGMYTAKISVYTDAYECTETATFKETSTVVYGVKKYTYTLQGTTYETKVNRSLLCTDYVAFTILDGFTTYISGKAFGKITLPNKTIVDVAGGKVDSEDIQQDRVTGDFIYVIYPNNNSGDTYTLNTTDVDSNNNSRIGIDDNVTDFTVDLNGTNVRTEITNKHKDNTIFVLTEDKTLNLVNTGSSATIGGTSGSSSIQEQYATLEIEGGTINVTAENNSPLTITGPSSTSSNHVGREGAINFSKTGGTLNIDGKVFIGEEITDVTVNDDNYSHTDYTRKGITSYLVSGVNSQNTTLNNTNVDLDINLKNGATVSVYGNPDEEAIGIHLVGQDTFTSADTIDIVLDNANIVVNSCKVNGVDGTGAAIQLEKFGAATINITIKNNSKIFTDFNCYGIRLMDCNGTINITLDNSIIEFRGGKNPFSFEECNSANFNLTIENGSHLQHDQWGVDPISITGSTIDDKYNITVPTSGLITKGKNPGGNPLYGIISNEENLYINKSTGAVKSYTIRN